MHRFVNAKNLLDIKKNESDQIVRRSEDDIMRNANMKGVNESDEWNCGSCTFQNSFQDEYCQICGNKKTSPTNMNLIACSLCTYENSSDCNECLMCGTRLEETKENRQNASTASSSSANPHKSTKLNVEMPQLPSEPMKKASTVPVGILRAQPVTKAPQQNSSSSNRFNLVDLCNIAGDDSDISDIDDCLARRKVAADKKRIVLKAGTHQPQASKRKDKEENDDDQDSDEEEEVYDYSEDGTYSEDSEESSDDDDDSSEEESDDEDESELEIIDDHSYDHRTKDTDGDILVNTPPRKAKKEKSSSLVNDDIDEFDSSSDLSVSEFFTMKNPSSPVLGNSSLRSVENFLSNKPREVKPSFPDVSQHYWTVKYLMRKGVCAINFNEFTLDKGATNPNSSSLLGSGKKGRSKTTTVDEIYEKRREKRSSGKQKKQNLVMMRRLKTDGSLTAPKKTDKKTKAPKQKKRKSKKRKKASSASIYDGDGGGGKVKRTKRSTSSKSKTKMSSNGGWIDTKVHILPPPIKKAI